MDPPPSVTADTAARKWTAKEVTEYLSRWGVEDAVQQAVNSAIKHKAADPVLHVAKFLEEKGHEAEAAQAARACEGAPPPND